MKTTTKKTNAKRTTTKRVASKPATKRITVDPYKPLKRQNDCRVIRRYTQSYGSYVDKLRIVKAPNGRYFNEYNEDGGGAGPFETFKEAEFMLKKHRPNAKPATKTTTTRKPATKTNRAKTTAKASKPATTRKAPVKKTTRKPATKRTTKRK